MASQEPLEDFWRVLGHLGYGLCRGGYLRTEYSRLLRYAEFKALVKVKVCSRLIEHSMISDPFKVG